MAKRKFYTNYSHPLKLGVENSTRGLGNVVQNYPSLGELLLRYQRGEDISNYINSHATTSDLRFLNRVGKVDISEIDEYVRKEVNSATAAYNAELSSQANAIRGQPSSGGSKPSEAEPRQVAESSATPE